MTFILEIPAIVRVLFVFFVILVTIGKKFNLGHAFFIGSLTLGLIFGLEPPAIAVAMFQSVVYPKTLALAIIVSLILILSNSLEKSGQMQRLLENFKGLVINPKINLVVFPGLIGLLPMPGGAIFSAPMVKELGANAALSSSRLSYVNYWFRHVWEYCWPLYPGILLATILADIGIFAFVFYMAPITIAAITVGYWPLSISNKAVFSKDSATKERKFWLFVKELVPILIAILPGLVLGIFISAAAPGLTVAKEIGLHIALCLSILWVWISNKFSVRQIVKLLTSFQIVKMIYLVVTILIFKGILEYSKAAEMISDEFLRLNVPLLLIAMFLPFLIGVISGYTLAYVGVSLPILLPLIQTYGQQNLIFPYLLLIMVCGFLGVLISPLHLCYILSNQYFDTTLSKVYQHLWIPCLALFLFAMAYFLVSKQFLV